MPENRDPENCVVVAQAELVSAEAKTLAAGVKKLRRLQSRCANCPNLADCPPLLNWTRLISQAIEDVTRTWNL